jgi:hypothetical protein
MSLNFLADARAQVTHLQRLHGAAVAVAPDIDHRVV